MTNYESARLLVTLYETRFNISEEQDGGGSHLTFHEVMDMNDIEVCLIDFEYDGNGQSGRYVIPHDGDFFVLNLSVQHRNRHNIVYVKWNIENE